VRVAAHDGHAGLGQPQLRADDVDDPLLRRAEAVDRDPELGTVRLELGDLGRGHRVEDGQGAWVRRHAVVGGRDGLSGPPDGQLPLAQAGERLGAGDLMDEVQVDRQDRRGARLLRDDVLVPDLLDDGSWCGHGGLAERRRSTVVTDFGG
jgi:hypothetical protein